MQSLDHEKGPFLRNAGNPNFRKWEGTETVCGREAAVTGHRAARQQ